ncbi:hypothetical protein ABW21_db0203002 [Orbilia brochopaga]|nr:hypothetical protein ABW21_db0203002 [Drechslerella brochopaga]
MPTRHNISTLTQLLVLYQLITNVAAWWDAVADNNGVHWYGRKRVTINGVTRGQTTFGECIGVGDVATRTPLDGMIVWDRPEEPATMAIALYGDTRCGLFLNSVTRSRPIGAIVLIRDYLRGLHLADFKQLDALTPKPRLRTTNTKSWRGVRVEDELGPGGLFAGVNLDELEGSIYWWDELGNRSYLPNALAWFNGIPYEPLQDPRYIQMFLREVLESAVNPLARNGDLSAELMKIINGAVGIYGNELYLPPPDPETNLQLNQELQAPGYDDPAEEEVINQAILEENINQAGTNENINQAGTDENLNQQQQEEEAAASPLIELVEDNGGNGQPEATLDNNLQRTILPNGSVRYAVQLPTGDTLEFVDGRGRIIPATGADNPTIIEEIPAAEANNPTMMIEEIPVEVPNYNVPTEGVTKDIADALRLALDDILARPFRQALVPTTATAVIDNLVLPLDGIKAIWQYEDEKDGFYAALENRVQNSMGSLLVARDLFRRYQEELLNLPVGTLGSATLEYAGVDAVDYFIPLAQSFQAAEDKIAWYNMTELMQLWNIGTFRIIRQLYGDWAAQRLPLDQGPDTPGFLDPNGGLLQPAGPQNIPQPNTQQQGGDQPATNVVPQRQPAQNLFNLAGQLSEFQLQDLRDFDPELMNNIRERLLALSSSPSSNANVDPALREEARRQLAALSSSPSSNANIANANANLANANANANVNDNGPRTRNGSRRPPPVSSPEEIYQEDVDQDELRRAIEEISHHSSDFETPTNNEADDDDDFTPGSGGTSTVLNGGEEEVVVSDEENFEYYEPQPQRAGRGRPRGRPRGSRGRPRGSKM